MEIGIDIEQNERFKTLSETFISKVYTEGEIAYAKNFKNYHEKLCAMWCVKEATVKAFSNLKIPFNKIELAHDNNGKPYIVKNETILSELSKNNITEIKVSLSHSKDYATAIVLIY